MKVLLIDAIGLQPAYLGCYGNDWIMTPNLDRFACDAVVFDRHYADHPTVRTASADWLRHGRFHVPDTIPPESEPPEAIFQFLQPESAEFIDATLAELESTTTVVCVQWTGLVPPWTIPQTYLDDYFSDDDLTPLLDPPTGPFPPEDMQSLRYTYSAAVTYFDEQFGELINVIAAEGLLDQLFVCVTAQSGLALGEHGYIGEHRAWLHNEIVHVPLLCRLPEAKEAGRRIASLTQPADLAATVWRFAGQGLNGGHGFDLMPLILGEAEIVRDYACSALQLGDSVEWALRTQDWAFLLPRQYPPDDTERREQLFAKPEDQYEVNDLRQQQIELVEEFENVLQQFLNDVKKPGPFQAPKLPD